MEPNKNNEISIFSDNGEKAVIPSAESLGKSEDSLNLKSDGIEKAILGETVKSLMIPESFELLLPNYVLDFREAKSLRKHQIQALATLVVDDGDINIYVCLGNGMEKLGTGYSWKLDDIIVPGMQSIFGDQCRVYHNVERDKPVQELKVFDPTAIRLDI